jgi:hypothetical protein
MLHATPFYHISAEHSSVAYCVAHSDGERGRKGEISVECRRLKTKGMEGNRSFRNRQVASSTLALGSNLLRVSYLISAGIVLTRSS